MSSAPRKPGSFARSVHSTRLTEKRLDPGSSLFPGGDLLAPPEDLQKADAGREGR